MCNGRDDRKKGTELEFEKEHKLEKNPSPDASASISSFLRRDEGRSASISFLLFYDGWGTNRDKVAFLVVLRERLSDGFDSDPQPRDLLFRRKLLLAPVFQSWLKIIEIWGVISLIV